MNLRNILEVNEKSQFVSLETSLRMLWTDPRVDIKDNNDQGFVTLNGDAVDRFWIPDLFIDQAKSLRSPAFMVKPASLRIHKGGLMRYVQPQCQIVSCI